MEMDICIALRNSPIQALTDVSSTYEHRCVETLRRPLIALGIQVVGKALDPGGRRNRLPATTASPYLTSDDIGAHFPDGVVPRGSLSQGCACTRGGELRADQRYGG